MYNPYKYSDTNKRYQSYEYYTRRIFGERAARIPLDAHFTCPNIDGSKGTGGCIYCANGSAACSTAERPDIQTLAAQYAAGRAVARNKWDCRVFLPYLQAHTNTYGAPEKVKAAINAALALPDAAGVIIATRADCLDDEIVRFIADAAERMYVSVELGLQSSSDVTARRINRAHTWADFVSGYSRLREASPKIVTCVHIIDGLPGENRGDMQKTAADVAALEPDMVKIHLLHVIKGTPLAGMYARGEYEPMAQADYVGAVCDQLEILPERTVIARLTGDGLADELIAPEWSRRKIAVLNDIDKEQARRDSWQGKYNRK